MADVFIAFNEAHPLTERWDQTTGLSDYIEFQQALQVFSASSLFTFSLSTTGKTSQFSPHVLATLPLASTKAHSHHLVLSLSLALTNSCGIARFLRNTKHSNKSLPRNASRTWEGHCKLQLTASFYRLTDFQVGYNV
jgi:hypothetical protein